MTDNVEQEVKTEVDKLKEGSTDNKEAVSSPVVTTDTVAKAIEERARAEGWRPLDEWEGDPSEWRDARSFVDRGELLNKISSQNRENKELRKAFKALQEHNLKASQAAYEKALNDFKAQKKEALEQNDAARVIELDEKIDEVKDNIGSVKAAIQVEQQTTVQAELPQEFVKWVDRNSWYAQNTEMKEFADDTGRAYARANPGKTPTEVLNYVSERVRKAYPEKFVNPNRDKPSGVEVGSSRRTGSGGTKTEAYELTEQEEKVYKTLHAQDPKFWTREKYISDLKGVTLR